MLADSDSFGALRSLARTAREQLTCMAIHGYMSESFQILLRIARVGAFRAIIESFVDLSDVPSPDMLQLARSVFSLLLRLLACVELSEEAWVFWLSSLSP